MKLAPAILLTSLSVALAVPVAAQESGGFVIRLGSDTTAVETFTRTPRRLEIDQIGRVPRVLRRHYVLDFDAAGAMSHVSAVITSPSAPGGAPPFQRVDVTLTGDSITIESRRDTLVQKSRVVFPAGTLPLYSGSPWSTYEALAQRLVSQKSDSLRVPAYFIGYPKPGAITVRRLGVDSVEIVTDNDRYHAQVDRAGHLVHLRPIYGTGQYSADRAGNLDVAAYTASFVAHEQQAGAIGALSTRDTVRVANAGGAALWIDYGRPAKRGRTIFGAVVPWGEVWRTGANAATQFRTDKALEMGGTTVPAGFYSLWTVPSPGGWKLVINSETGQWGTEHKAEKDLYKVDMSVSSLADPVERFTIRVAPSAQGGVIQMDWDTTRASIPFTVKP